MKTTRSPFGVTRSSLLNSLHDQLKPRSLSPRLPVRRTLLATFLMLAVAASGFALIRANGAGRNFAWPEGLTKIFKMKALRTALAARTSASPALMFAGVTSNQDFGTGTGSQTSQTGSTAFLPNPTSGTTWARAGATAPNAPIVLATASNPLGTTGAYVRGVASSSTSVAKFSPIVGYTGSTEFYTSFKVLFGDSAAGSTATSGTWTFYQGAGAMYSDANDFTGAQVFTGLRFTYGTGGALALTYRGGSSFINTGLTTTTFSSATVYTVEIIGNNKASGTINYTYGANARSVAVQKFDLYINGALIGDDLAEALLPAGTNITSNTFIGVSSTANAANVFVDDVSVYNMVPSALGPVITAGGPLTRQQGTAASNSTIATVSDTSTGTLTVTATTVPTGLTVTNIVNSGGTVTADVAADCTAATGANTVVLTVTNSTTGVTNTANLTVNVDPNTPPVLTYNSANVTSGTTGTVTPATGPSDNVSVASIVVQSVTPATTPGTITVNNTTGVVTVPNNVPAGTYTVTIRATDNCGGANGTTDAVFTLTVGCPTSFQVNNLGDTPDANPGNGVCADGTGNCTLRAAIQEANALTTCSPMTINFSVNGTITLGSALPAIGHPNLTITGNGAANTIISGNNTVAGLSVATNNRTLALNSLTITNANSTTNGAALSLSGTNNTLTLTNCVLSNNTTTTNGGGLYLSGTGTTATLTNTTVSGNTAASGGGLYVSVSTLTLNNCTISGNTCTGSGGGVLVTNGATVNANDSLFSNNSSPVRGAAIGSVNSSNVNVTRCTFTGHTGSSVMSSSLTTNITNSTISGNTGTGIDAVGGTTTITNSTFSANTGTNLFASSLGTVLNLVNTLVAGNLPCVQSTQATINATNSLIQGGLSCVNGTNTNNLTSAPLLGTLGNYGGTTQTVPLLPGSPAINAGTSSGAPTSDQRGIARVGNVDIGAFESQGFTLAFNGGSPQSVAINSAFANPLSVTVNSANSEPVDGGQITFTPPGSGATATIAGNPATISGGAATSGTVTANGTAGGPYNVTASATGAAASVNFALTNTAPAAVFTLSGTTTSFSENIGTVFFTVQRANTGAAVSVDYATDGGTATAGACAPGVDYVAASGTFNFAANETMKTFSVTICNDAVYEANQTFIVTLSNPVGGTIGMVGTQTATINNDDAAPTVTINNVSQAEGNSGTTNFQTTFTVSGASEVAGGFNFQTADGTATAPSDYTGINTNAILPANVNRTTATLNGELLAVNGDTTAEANETVLLNGSSCTDCTFADNQGVATILNDDCPTSFTVNDLGDGADATPGDYLCATSGGVCTLRAAIQEANAITACSPLTINFSVTGTIDAATVLPPITHPNLTISGPGANQLTVSGINSTHQMFAVNSSGINLQIAGLTITNGFASTGTNAGAIEFNSTGGTLTVTSCALIGNGGNSNIAAQIYSNSSAGIVITDSTISGNPIGRGIVVDRTPLTVTNSTISGNAGFGIRVFTGSPAVTITLLNSTLANNGSSGVGFNTASGGSVTLTTKNSIIANNGGSQIASGTGVTITSQGNNLCSDATLTPTATGDLINTNPLLSSLGNYGGPTQTHALLPGSPAINAGTLSGAPTNDQRGSARVGNVDIGAFESQGFTLALSGGSPQAALLNASFANPLAVTVTANNTSEPVNGGQVIFTPPGSGASAVLVTSPATIASGAASVTATANGTAGSYNVAATANGATPTVNFALTNTAPSVVFAFGMATTSFSEAVGSVTFTVTRTGTGTPVSVDYATSGGTATPGVCAPGVDYVAASGTLNFAANDTQKTFNVTICNDAVYELNQTFNVTLSNAVGGSIGTPETETATINNDDAVPTIAVSDKSQVEGNSGTANFNINVTLTGATEVGANVSVGTSNGTATAGSDYTTFETSINFVPGPDSPTQTVPVPVSVFGDTMAEPDETFFLNASNCDAGCTISDSQGVVTILNDDCPTTFTVNDLGDAGDATPGDNLCATSGGVCTLRAAIEEANAITACSPLTINFSVTGTINLLAELPWVEHPNITIQGPGANLLTVTRNAASAFTIFIITSDVAVINDLTISNGDASGTFDVGGGIYNGGSALTINRCHITGNTASQGGGVMNEGGNIFINNSTISNNSAGAEGGGIYNAGNEGTAAMTLTNCTISGNSVTGQGFPGLVGRRAKYAQLNTATAGGLANYAEFGGSATVSLINCTITGNSAASNPGNRAADSANAGGIFSGTDGAGSDANINLKNTLLAGNTNAQALTATGGTLTSQGNNLDGDGTTGFTNGVNGDRVGTAGTPINPLLATLSNYGGSTPTHALLPGSLAINAGTGTGAPTNDQRNFARVGNVDIGAFESQGFVLSIAGGNNQTTPVNTNFASALQVSVVSSAGEPVNGGQITFTPPLSGASATVAGSPATIIASLATTGTVTANSITGSYNVSASTTGATAINFALTNTCQTIAVTNPGINTGTVGVMFTATFTQTGGIGMTTFSTASTLPTGLMLSSAGVLSGTPTQSGSFPITVVATDANNCLGSSVGYMLTISCPMITVNPASFPGGVVGTVYTQTLTPSGGSSANYTYSFTGTLPPGLTLSSGPSTTGTLSGNPTTSGSYNFTIIATDANGCTGNRAYAVTINQAPAITSANTTTFTVNTASSFPITTSGVPTVTTITQSGALPTGVMFTDNGNGTATLSGTPQVGTTGNYPLIFNASNGITPNATQNFTLVVSGFVCPSTLTVNDLGETSDNNAGDGFCDDGTGKCTLRAAIQEANAIPACTPLTINFSVTGTINLATELPALNHPNLTIQGPGASQLTVQRSFANGTPAFRVFYAQSGIVSISGLTITNGGGNVYAAGILATTDLTLDGCVVTGNNAVNAFAGGIGWIGGALTIRNSTIAGNSADNGGAIHGGGTSFTMSNSTVRGNTSVFQVAGLWISPSVASSLTNVTISDNTAGTFPSALLNIGAVAVTLTNCTVANNSGLGAGLDGLISLQNTLVANNATTNFTSVVKSLGNNLSTGNDAAVLNQASDLNNTNPQLAPLGNYGGPTQTRALLPGSPAINAGNNCVLTANGCGANNPPSALTSDQRGFGRVGAVDIGAFESRGFTLAIVSGNNQTTPPTAAFANALLVSVTSSFGEPVQGGRVTFTPPGSGPSATLVGNPATLNASGQASVTATANNQQGSYQVVAAANGANTVNFNLTNSCSVIALSGLPNGQASIPYSQTVTAMPAGGSYSFAVTGGALPTGLTLASSGALTGIPTVGGTFNFTITATGFGGVCNVSQSYAIAITCPPITLTPNLPRGVQGTFYSQAVTAGPTGTTYSYALTTNLLPPGLTLNSATGAITGTPSAPGNYAFVITATGWGNGSGGGCTKSQAYEILITGTCATITVNPASFPGATLGTAYNQTVSATGGVAPHTFAVTQGALPPGLALDATTGALTGTPMTGGTFSFRLTATGTGGCIGSRNYVLTVACVPLTFGPASLPNATMGQNYSQALTITPAGAYTFSLALGNFPPGYTMNSAGVISGITNQTGTFNFSIKALGGTCQMTKAYTLVVNGGNAALAMTGDYDGDGKSDPVLWSASTGVWQIIQSRTQQASKQSWGMMGDVSLLGDYDGDGKSDLAVFRPSTATFYVKRSSDGGALIKQWGDATDVPVPGDYDGDGLTDLAVFRPGEGQWYILRSSDQQYEVTAWGAGYAPYNDVPAPGDYDGDGKTDVAIFRQANGHWYIRRSSNGQTMDKTWGLGTDLPMPGDYDGDGKTDLAVWRGTEGTWYILQSGDSQVQMKPWGAAYAPYFDTPMAGDYDGDGKTDLAVWRKSEGRWYVLQSADGKTQVVTQGQASDKVVTATPRQ